jgi:hypothetical protein
MVTLKVLDVSVRLERVTARVRFSDEDGDHEYVFPPRTTLGEALERMQRDVDDRNLAQATTLLADELRRYVVNGTEILPTGISPTTAPATNPEPPPAQTEPTPAAPPA